LSIQGKAGGDREGMLEMCGYMVSRFVRLLRRPDAPIKDRQSPDFIVIDKDLSDFKYVGRSWLEHSLHDDSQ
jgi:hypothetical protein